MTRRPPTQILLRDGAIGYTDIDLGTCARTIRRIHAAGGLVVRLNGRPYELAAIKALRFGDREMALADLRAASTSKRARPPGAPRARSANGGVHAPEADERPSPALRLPGPGGGSRSRRNGGER